MYLLPKQMYWVYNLVFTNTYAYYEKVGILLPTDYFVG